MLKFLLNIISRQPRCDHARRRGGRAQIESLYAEPRPRSPRRCMTWTARYPSSLRDLPRAERRAGVHDAPRYTCRWVTSSQRCPTSGGQWSCNPTTSSCRSVWRPSWTRRGIKLWGWRLRGRRCYLQQGHRAGWADLAVLFAGR